jgi:hypothetical protein
MDLFTRIFGVHCTYSIKILRVAQILGTTIITSIYIKFKAKQSFDNDIHLRYLNPLLKGSPYTTFGQTCHHVRVDRFGTVLEEGTTRYSDST